MTQDQNMELVQVYASAWALVGSRFDNGNGMADALEAKAAVVAALDALQRAAYASGLRTGVGDAEALTKDAERLDHIQVTGSTVELVNFGPKPVRHSFRVGGLCRATNFDLRLAVDAAITAQKEQI